MTEHDTKTLQTSLAEKLDADLAALKSNTVTTERPANGYSVAEQLVSTASTIKGIHRDIDALQAEFGKQLDALRKRLGGRG
jgi:hypothetical protein